MKTYETDLIKILELIGLYRNDLSESHNAFVKNELQKDYDFVTKTYELNGKIYTGTFRENSERKNNKIAYEKEAKLATVLASLGFDVILIEEPTGNGTHPDAIVNGIVMDFKEINAFSQNDVTKNTLGNNYKSGIEKANTEGVCIYLHEFTEKFVNQNMVGKTRPRHNGLALFFHENTGKLQLFDMKKIRAEHLSARGRTPNPSVEPSAESDISSSAQQTQPMDNIIDN